VYLCSHPTRRERYTKGYNSCQILLGSAIYSGFTSKVESQINFLMLLNCNTPPPDHLIAATREVASMLHAHRFKTAVRVN
jgi:hypothetical protein